MAPHIAAITLGVRDVRRSVDFYRAMGFEPDVRSDGRVALFQLNGLVLQVVRRGVIDPEMGGGYPGEGLISLRHNVTASAEVDAIITLVSRAGGRVSGSPERCAGGSTGVVRRPRRSSLGGRVRPVAPTRRARWRVAPATQGLVAL